MTVWLTTVYATTIAGVVLAAFTLLLVGIFGDDDFLRLLRRWSFWMIVVGVVALLATWFVAAVQRAPTA